MCIAQATAILGFDFALPFMPLYLQHDLGVHGLAQIAVWSGIISFGPAIPATIFGPIWGRLGDRIGYRPMLLRAMLSAAVFLALMGFAQSLWMLLVLRMIQGGLTGTIYSAQALIAASAPEEDMGRAIGLLQMSVYAGATLGPVAGGIVAQVAGYRASFMMAGILLAIGTVIVFFFVSEPERARKSDIRRKAHVPLAGLLHSPVFAGALAFTIVAQLVASSQLPTLPLFVQELLNGSGSVSADTGWLLAFSGLAAALGAYAAGRSHRRWGLAPPLIISTATALLILVLQAASPSYLIFLLLRSGSAFALGALFALVGVWAAASSPKDAKGAAFGLLGAASSLGFGAGPLLGGALVSIAGLRALFLVAGAVLLIPLMGTIFLKTRMLPNPAHRDSRAGEALAAG